MDFGLCWLLGGLTVADHDGSDTCEWLVEMYRYRVFLVSLEEWYVLATVK